MKTYAECESPFRAAADSRRKLCLVVDDSRATRLVAGCILKTMGFDVVEASNGKEALDFCRLFMPEIIMLDWCMPVMNGLDFIHHLRRTPGGDVPKVIMCTSETAVDRVMKAVQAGADELIIKPFDSEIIETKFRILGIA